MSSFPALAIQQPASPVEQLGKVLQIKSLMQNQQIQQQQLELQKQKVADEKATTTAMQSADPTKPTYYDDVAQAVLKNGGSATAAQAWQKHGFDIKKQISDIAMQDATTGTKNLETYLGKNKAIGDSLSVLTDPKQVPDEQLHSEALSHVNNLQQSGILDAPHAQQMTQQIQASSDPAALRSQIQMAANSFLGQKAIADQAKAAADLAKTQQETREKQWQKFEGLGLLVNTETGEVKTPGGQMMTPAMIESKYLNLQQAKNQKLPISAADQAWMKGYEHMKELVPQYSFNLNNGGAAVDAGGNPSAIAQAIATNRMKWSEAVSPRTPQVTKNAIMAQVYKLNPNYDTAEFGLESDAAKKARSGAWADTRVAYNTAIDHSKQLLDTVDALNNSDVKKLNSLKNFFKTEFGSPDVPDFQAVANAYNHEVTSVVSKGHITDKEVETGGAVLPANASGQAIRKVIASYNQLMASKRTELDKVIKAGSGTKADSVLGVQSTGESGTATDPNAKPWEKYPVHQ